MRNIRIIIILAWLIAVCSCGGRSGLDVKFQEIDRLCDSLPEAAIDSLATINQTGLSKKDLNRYRLLWIKSRDKAYIAHTSDTLILDLIDYYDKHRSEGLYAEALYYGGRVYSDIGDLPTALEFFQKSLDQIPEDDTNLRFKGTVLDQTGRLLQTLRLDSAAIHYLEKSLQIEIQNNYYYESAFTHGLIANSLLRKKNLKEARIHMDEALLISSRLKSPDRRTILSEFAYMLYKEGKNDSAIMVIKALPSSVDSLTTPYCLAVAANIYKEAGILDTAYMYARKLTLLNSPKNKKTGYRIIFSEEMKRYISKDTLMNLMPEYEQIVEDYLDMHETEQALIQNARFNYSTQIKKRQEAEQKLSTLKQKLWMACSGIVFILLMLCLIVFIRKYNKSKKESQIIEGIILSDRLKENSIPNISELNEDSKKKSIATDTLHGKNLILAEINKAKKQNPSESLDPKLKSNPLYKDLKEKAENKRVMGKDVTWRMIEDLIDSVSPGFDNRLSVLTEGNVTASERHIAYLIKFGFSQVQMASLLAKSTSTISIQRTSLAKKIGYDKSAIAAIIVRL